MEVFLNEQSRKEFEESLNSWRQELVHGAGRTVTGMHEGHLDNFPDPSDRAFVEADQTAELRIRDRERKLLQKIEQALERLKEGTYGLCEECGEMINVDRLRARPVTTLCLQCKAEQEVIEKRKRS